MCWWGGMHPPHPPSGSAPGAKLHKEKMVCKSVLLSPFIGPVFSALSHVSREIIGLRAGALIADVEVSLCVSCYYPVRPVSVTIACYQAVVRPAWLEC